MPVSGVISSCDTSASSSRRVRSAACSCSARCCRSCVIWLNALRERRHLVAAILARARRQIARADFARRILEASQPAAHRAENQQRGDGRADRRRARRRRSPSVGPSCRSAERGIAITTPTGTPLTKTAPAGPRGAAPAARACWRRRRLPVASATRAATAAAPATARARTTRGRRSTARESSRTNVVWRPGAVGRHDAAVLHDGDERHASFVFLPEELLDVELSDSPVSASPRSRAMRRVTSGGGGPGATSMRDDEVHERAALQRRASRRETARSRSQCASRGSGTT